MAHPQEAQVGSAGGLRLGWLYKAISLRGAWNRRGGVGPKTGRVHFHAACQVVENVTTYSPRLSIRKLFDFIHTTTLYLPSIATPWHF